MYRRWNRGDGCVKYFAMDQVDEESRPKQTRLAFCGEINLFARCLDSGSFEERYSSFHASERGIMCPIVS